MKTAFYPLIILISSILLLHSCSHQPKEPESKIIVIGLDGLDLTMLQDLTAKNELPVFQKLLQDGAYGILESYRPMISPLIWTSIATGRMPADHGILGFSYRQNDQATISIPSSKRTCAALWNITSHSNISTTVMGWYATWPSEEINGLMVSDRFVQSIHVADAGTLNQTLPQVTYPEEAAYSLYDYRKEYTQIGCEQLRDFIAFTEDECAAHLQAPFDLRDPIHHLRLIMARAETWKAALLHQLQTQPTHLTMALFDCTDTAAHLFMPYHPPKQDNISQQDYDRFHNAVTQMYKYADSLLQDVMLMMDEDDTLLIVSDHGFRSGSDRPAYSAETTEGNAVLWHHTQGTLIAYSESIKPQTISNASVLDIAPTLLAMLGIPASTSMPGKVIEEIVDVKSLPEKVITRVEDWDFTFFPPELPDTGGMDPLEMERLQSIGYAAGTSASDNRTSPDGLSIEDHLNLAVYYHGQDDTAQALIEAEAAYQLNPAHAKTLEHLAALYMELERYDDALKSLLPLKENYALQYQDAMQSNDQNHILSMRHSMNLVYGYLGDVYFALQRFTDAVESYRQANETVPNQPKTLYNLGLCYGITGQYEPSEQMLESLLKLQPGHHKAKHSLAVAKLRMNKPKEARELLLSLLQQETGDPNLYYLVGQSYTLEQDYPQAKVWYEKALQVDANFAKAQRALEGLIHE